MNTGMVTLLMTSRSGSSMVADIFARHGFFWARNTDQNPLVGGRKVRYHSFENQYVKSFFRDQFGTPLGDMVTFDDAHVRNFRAVIGTEYGGHDPCMWKGAVEFYPMWQAIDDAEGRIKPIVIWRPMNAVMDSLRAKRKHLKRGTNEEALLSITSKRYEIMGRLAADYAFPVVETDKIVKGDWSSLEQAFDHYGFEMDEAVVAATVQPKKWETDR
jgi:hypothetical protein